MLDEATEILMKKNAMPNNKLKFPHTSWEGNYTL
jgi:hypothetical protein